MSAAEELDRIEARAEGATPGPWTAETTGREGGDHWYVCDEGEAIASIHANDGSDEETRQPDAEFIAHARTDLPRTVAALRAVLALHVEVPLWEYDDVNGVWVLDDQGEKVPLPPVCQECTPHDSLLAIEDCEWTEDYEVVTHPCPTVTAITAALTGDPT